MTDPGRRSPDDVEDHSIHDLVRIRLVGAPASASSRLSHVLGTTPAVPTGDADMTITYLDPVRGGSTLRFLGRGRSAFDDERFYVVEPTPGGPALLSLPFEQVGHDLHLTCERGASRLSPLVPLVNLTMLAKGIVPIHGSAFTWRGAGVVAAGWSKGGKTETLLAFMADGAAAIADEWTYVSPDRSIAGAAEPIRLEQSHLAGSEGLRVAVPRRARARLRALGAVATAHRGAFVGRRRLPGAKIANALMPAVTARQGITVSPQQLFGDRYAGRGRLEHLVLLMTAEIDRPQIRSIDASEVVDRMVFAHLHHRLDLVARYYESRFAFPDRRCELLDAIERTERELLHHALTGIPCAEVRVPYPPTIAELHRVVASHLESAA